MEGLSQILPINGAMNQDDDHRYVRSSDGQVIERVNLRPNSIDGKRFINEKIKGAGGEVGRRLLEGIEAVKRKLSI